MDQYAKSFTKPSIRIGTITVLLAMLGSFFPNIYLYLAHGVWPDASHMFSAWGSVAMAIILRLLGVPAWITIVCCIFGNILITYFLYKKKLIK